MTRITKRKAQEVATRQSQRAQSVTAAMRAHGWRVRYVGTERSATDDGDRAKWAQAALDNARAIARDAEATLSWLEAWARQEGAH